MFKSFNRSVLTNTVAIILLLLAGAWLYQTVWIPLSNGETIIFKDVLNSLFSLAASVGLFFARDANVNDKESGVDH